ncbi:MAG: hypothetical protein AB1750_07205 [Chloroflexota bacterium]
MSKKISEPESADQTPVNVSVLADHYQKTFEVAYENWRERNRLFVFLVLTAVAGLLIIQRGDIVNDLLVRYVQNYFALQAPADQGLIDEISKTVPFSVLLSGILVTMFYFMQRLHATNLAVMRTYKYLALLEKEIKPHLGLPGESSSFTREGKFYWDNRASMQTMSKWSYVVVLFFLLIPFMYVKLQGDINSAPGLITSVDVIISLLTFAYWIDYARSAFKLDKDPDKDEAATSADSKSKKR